MKRLLVTLMCSATLFVAPCALESWSIAVDPGAGDSNAYVGVNLDFGTWDFVVPIVPLGD